MGDYETTFDWLKFPEGTAKFNGGIRGADEKRHETYAVDIDGHTVFGEISKAYLSNQNDYDIEVISFGFGMEENVGNSHPNARGSFTKAQLTRVEALVTQLVLAGFHFEDRPSALSESEKSHFQGRIMFRSGWANVRAEIGP